MDLAKTRNSNIEFLRILSMFSIIFLHKYRHPAGGAIFDSSFSFNQVFLILLCSWGCACVFVFVIVSSYCLIDSRELKLDKLLNLLFCTSLYATLSFLFSCVYLGKLVFAKEIIKAILTPVLNNYWFILICLFVDGPI